MSKYLNVFNTLAEYQAFSASTEYVQPNVALVKETNVLYYDYGDNKPQADMSDYKVESEETSLGGDKYGNSAITKINYIPTGITHLNSAFRGFNSLVDVPPIPSGVTSMDQTFSGCRSIVNAPEIPSGVTDMNYTFDNCEKLVNVPPIPNSVTTMFSTFSGCRSIVNAPAIPSGVTNINMIFYVCTNLKTVTFLATTPPSYSSSLQMCYALKSIYVPDESVDAYKTATGWSEFADKYKPLSSKPTK